MDIFTAVQQYAHVALTLQNLSFCFLGVLIGTLVGVLPGLGPVGAISLLLPVSFQMQPASAIILLAGIYYGAQYGGSTTSILMRIPGEASSVITCIDGYKMALKGRAGAALGISAIGSFAGGTFAVIGLMLLAPPLSKLALALGPPEYFALLVIGLILLSFLGTGSRSKAGIMALLGLLIGTVGVDLTTGEKRFTAGTLSLMDGVNMALLAIGIFGLGEIISTIADRSRGMRDVIKTKFSNLLPNREEWRRALGPIGRGSVLGFMLGILPGGGAVVSSFVSYAIEKKRSKNPEEFGEGAIEGVAGPETANNAATAGAFIPLLSLGLPANAVMAILLGALQIHGVQPGPLFLSQHPDLFWAIIVSMYIGNVMLLVLNLPLVGIWVQLLRVPYDMLFPLIITLAVIGTYSLSGATSDLVIMGIAGLVGYWLSKLNYDPAPLIFGVVLSPLLENAFRQSLILSDGSISIFLERPITLSLLVVAFLSFTSAMWWPLVERLRTVIMTTR